MDRKLWERVYTLVRHLAHSNLSHPNQRYSDGDIVLVELWATLHNQSILWATHPDNHRWPDLMPVALPSQSTMSRRQKLASVAALRYAIMTYLRQLVPGEQGWIRKIDGRALTINGFSKDPDAAWGYAAKALANGYKLHCIWDEGLVPAVWEVCPMNTAEQKVAVRLIERLPAETTGYLLGDSNYDSNPLHSVATAHELQLVAPPQKKNRGLGHRRHEPSRLHALRMLDRKFGATLYVRRSDIERNYGHLVTNPAGLDRLPWHVRRLHRVQRFVMLKLIIEGCYRWLQLLMSPKDRPLIPLTRRVA
jgi:hypothetical protein